jgi:KDO2-lipid IV(A) lauroyltransferase
MAMPSILRSNALADRRRSQLWRKRRKRLKRTCAYVFVRALYRLGHMLPREAGLKLFGAIGCLARVLDRSDQRRIRSNLRAVFGGQWSPREIDSTARAVLPSLAKNLFDAVYLSRCSDREFNRLVTSDDLEQCRREQRRGKGLIMITAHLGCFESLLQFFARSGFPSFAVGRRSFDARIDSIIHELRSGPNIAYMDRSGSSRAILRLLREGRAFGVLIDQDTGVEGVFAHFLGSIAYTPSAPVRIAMRLDIPAFVVTTARQPDGRHHVSLRGPVAMRRTGDFKCDLVHNVEKVNGYISEAIRRNPEQWVWMHKRWKRRPDAPEYRDIPNIRDYR